MLPPPNADERERLQDEKNQVFTTNLWLEMRWVDARMVWRPEAYGGVRWMHLPAGELWTPDIVLYNK